MSYLIKSFGYALNGIATALRAERNFRLQWLLGLMVFLTGELLDFDYWQRTLVLLLVFLVLALELHNCAIEKVCDSSGRNFNGEKKLAKDFAAGSVLLFSVAAALIFFSFIENNIDTIFDKAITDPLALIALILIFVLNVPICFFKSSNSFLITLFLLSLLINGLFIVISHEQPLFLMLAGIFHVMFGIAYLKTPLTLSDHKNHLNSPP